EGDGARATLVGVGQQGRVGAERAVAAVVLAAGRAAGGEAVHPVRGAAVRQGAVRGADVRRQVQDRVLVLDPLQLDGGDQVPPRQGGVEAQVGLPRGRQLEVRIKRVDGHLRRRAVARDVLVVRIRAERGGGRVGGVVRV